MKLPSLRRDPVKALLALSPEERANLFMTDPSYLNWAVVSTGGMTTGGVPVSIESVISIPAVSSAIRLLAETISMLPLNVYKGRNEDKQLADQTWQYRLLTEMPGMGDFTPVDLISDTVSSMDWEGNAFLRKVKAPSAALDRMPEVIGLILIDPTRVEVKREAGEKIFVVREHDEKGTYREKKYSQADILHIRGWTPSGSDRGVSPIWIHRDKLSAILAQNLAQGRFFSHGMVKNLGLEYPGKLDEAGAERLREAIQNQVGLANSYFPFVAQGGAKIVPTGMTMAESQFVEGDRQNMINAAHMFRIPPSFLVPDAARGRENYEQDLLRFYTLSLAPRLRRIELAFFSDADLFPQRQIYPEFDTRKLLRTDAKTQAEVDHMQIQDGSLLPDERRARDGQPPLPPIPTDPSKTPGMVPQLTPVGGAPNPAPPPKQPDGGGGANDSADAAEQTAGATNG